MLKAWPRVEKGEALGTLAVGGGNSHRYTTVETVTATATAVRRRHMAPTKLEMSLHGKSEKFSEKAKSDSRI